MGGDSALNAFDEYFRRSKDTLAHVDSGQEMQRTLPNLTDPAGPSKLVMTALK